MAKFDKEAVKELESLKEHEVFRSRLIEFYNKHCPDNLSRVDQTLKQWQGREEDLFEELHKKYLGAAEAKQMQQVINHPLAEARLFLFCIQAEYR